MVNATASAGTSKVISGVSPSEPNVCVPRSMTSSPPVVAVTPTVPLPVSMTTLTVVSNAPGPVGA